MVSDRTVARLSLYKRLLAELEGEGRSNVYSHELAVLAGCTAAQVRRDVMAIGYTGSPVRGYEISALAESIGSFLYHSDQINVALVGVGNLGRALLAYSPRRNPRLPIVAAFDKDPAKVNRVIHGCRCYPVEQLDEVVRREEARVGIVAVPATDAQDIAGLLCHAGVKGLLNFAPVRLWVPPSVYVEDLDVSVSLEKAAFYAGQTIAEKEVSR